MGSPPAWGYYPFIGSASWSTWSVSVIAGVAATLVFAWVFISASAGVQHSD